ncbi:MAG: DUF4342 domain-containing protein [Ardenticatenaceae bacterium]|nr:DUF4342 domain-containing protein [Ardenticatenaceae bacterium]
MSEEKIHVEEETVEEAQKESTKETSWTEEITVAGSELWHMVMKLAHEATVRRIVIKNEKHDIHFEVPMLVGVAGIALLPAYAALGVIALLVTDCSILVERAEEKKPEPDVEIAVE